MRDNEHGWFMGDENGDVPWNDDGNDKDDEVGICQNCDAHLTLQQGLHGKLFCSEKCKQTAKAIRYGRATLRDGRYEREPEVREALNQKIAHCLGGGYPEKARKLSPEQREAIFTRDNKRCRICGETATEIDHIVGSSPDPENLQALCKPCNMTKARDHFRPATPDEATEGDAIWARIRAPQPVRPCDDEKQWNKSWRKLASELRQRALS